MGRVCDSSCCQRQVRFICCFCVHYPQSGASTSVSVSTHICFLHLLSCVFLLDAGLLVCLLVSTEMQTDCCNGSLIFSSLRRREEESEVSPHQQKEGVLEQELLLVLDHGHSKHQHHPHLRLCLIMLCSTLRSSITSSMIYCVQHIIISQAASSPPLSIHASNNSSKRSVSMMLRS